MRLTRTTGFARITTRIEWYRMDQRITLRTIELMATKAKPLVEKAQG